VTAVVNATTVNTTKSIFINRINHLRQKKGLKVGASPTMGEALKHTN
jgi:hypothetical protein